MTAKNTFPTRNTKQHAKSEMGRGKRVTTSSRQSASLREAERDLLAALREVGAARAKEVITVFEQVEAWKKDRLLALTP
jgi:hypothetical protein